MAVFWFSTTVILAAVLAYEHRADITKFIDWVKARRAKQP